MKPDWMCVLTAETDCSESELFLYNHRKATKQSLKNILGSQGVNKPFSTMMAARKEIIAHSVSRMSLWYLFAGCHAETALCLYFKFVKWHLLNKQLNFPRCHFLQGFAMWLCPYCGMRCFFSVCAWLQWTQLNGAHVAATKVVGAGILMSHWPLCVQVTSLNHSPVTHITSPSRPVHVYMSIKVL